MMNTFDSRSEEAFYIGYYATQDKSEVERVNSPAASNLMDYVASVISSRLKTTIISASWSTAGLGYYRARATKNCDNIKVLFPPSIGVGAVIFKLISILLAQVWLFAYLMLKAKKNTLVVVYHAPTLFWPVYLSKKLRSYKLVLQVCEIYSDVATQPIYKKIFEKKLIQIADRYVISTELLINHPLLKKKPYSVCSGVYRSQPAVSSPPNDGKIHVIYSGIIDSLKQGAMNAVSAAEYLDANYCLHIIGFGADEDILDLKQKIININALGKCTVIFSGMKSGASYVDYLQRCHIGLSTQSSGGNFNNSSFPAKIFSYFGNGLQVVSVNTLAISQSYISTQIKFYDIGNPRNIAEAIHTASVSLNSRSSFDLMKTLNLKFEEDFFAYCVC